MKLISMTDFVLLISKQTTNEGNSLVRNFNKIKNYAQFLKQPLTLGMFIPCDEGGNVLEQPCDVMNTDGCRDCACRVYKKSKTKVLFEGFNDIEAINYHISRKRNIEYLSKFGTIKLTENALKQIGI